MDAAQRWLKANDPQYQQEQAKKLRKREERKKYYQSLSKEKK